MQIASTTRQHKSPRKNCSSCSCSPGGMEAKFTHKHAMISWPGYGVMFFWQLGVLQFLQASYDLRRCTMVGSSAGALLSILAACTVDPQTAVDTAYKLCVEHGAFQRPLGLIGIWGGIVRQWLDELLPEDAAQRCNGGHVRLVLTTLPLFRRVVVSDFKSRDDLIEAALASAHLPLILNWKLSAAWRGQRCVDGSLLYILTRRCQFLRPSTCDASDLLLFDPLTGLSLSGIIHLLCSHCISLPGNAKAAVQQLMSQGVMHAEKLAAAGAFDALPSKSQRESDE